MIDSGVWVSYIAVIAIAYTAFVFISESLNPFRVKKDNSHRRHKLGKSLALIFFIVATFALIVEPHLGVSRSHLVLAVAVLFTVLAVKPLFKYFRFTKKTISPSLKEHAEEPILTTPSRAITTESKVEAEPNPAVTLSSAKHVSLATKEVDALSQLDTTPEQPTISISDEHQLELKISAVNHDSDFDDLDQTIAEADFIHTDLTLSETNEIAQPDRSTHADDVESVSNISADLSYEDSAEQSENKPSDPTDTLFQMLDTQNEKIQRLAKNNQSLIKDREILTDEVSELKFSLQKVNAIARKGIAQRDQALKLKNSALSLAAMEVKKRKLTEVKARKALMKMNNSLKMLADQSTE